MIVLNNDVKEYICKGTTADFQEWFKDYCEECWSNGYGDCSVCKERKTKIINAFGNGGEVRNG